MLLSSLGPAAAAGIVTYAVGFGVRNAYHYRLQDSSWRTVVNLGTAYSLIALATYATKPSIFPHKFTKQEQQVHRWRGPYGLTTLTIEMSAASAGSTARMLAPNKDGKTHPT